MATKKEEQRSLIINDLHLGHGEMELIDLVCFKFGKDFKPTHIFLNGDIIDCYAISSYMDHPKWYRSFEYDVRITKEFLTKLRKAFPNAAITYIYGNHEFRLESYLMKRTPEIFEQVTLQKILELDSLNIQVVNSGHPENWITHNDVLIGHFDMCKKQPGYTAYALLVEKGVSLIQAHGHKYGASSYTTLTGTIYGYENPCLCSLDVNYKKSPQWSHGFAVSYYNGDRSTTYVIPIHEKQFVFEGKQYSVP